MGGGGDQKGIRGIFFDSSLWEGALGGDNQSMIWYAFVTRDNQNKKTIWSAFVKRDNQNEKL